MNGVKSFDTIDPVPKVMIEEIVESCVRFYSFLAEVELVAGHAFAIGFRSFRVGPRVLHYGVVRPPPITSIPSAFHPFPNWMEWNWHSKPE